ncbi:carbon-nitrogen family hydrolase [Macrococcus equipercicus]|uniref:Carbon-nitrogen family hydrolase n=1 Tax=Macrococcus equipercicus TaxID=69967 RepID=A0ABQ6R7B3_9STAP|nr:carbon-nitrogen family hydrolase [Macrococcus equipercicus]KAA1037728.1 carbon-nitrogen family hydrolase [Macrococcus equipercicus]
MKTAVYQMTVIPGQPRENLKKVADWLNRLPEDTDVAVLPEMWNTSYTLQQLADLIDDEGSLEISALQNIARLRRLNIVAGSIAVKHGDKFRNRAVVIDRHGHIIYHYDKVHLVPLLNEPEFLEAGDEFSTFKLDDQKMGLIICYDLRFPEITRKLALDGAEVIYVVAEWPLERITHFTALLKARAIENQCYIVACNASGECEDTVFGGQSMVVSPSGAVIVAADIDEATITADIDIEQSEAIRQAIPILKSRRTDLY